MSICISEYRGDWIDTRRYYAGDIVRSASGIWLALRQTMNSVPRRSEDWTLVFPIDLQRTPFYESLLTQSARNAPTEQILVNHDTLTITWSYSDTGMYKFDIQPPRQFVDYYVDGLPAGAQVRNLDVAGGQLYTLDFLKIALADEILLNAPFKLYLIPPT